MISGGTFSRISIVAPFFNFKPNLTTGVLNSVGFMSQKLRQFGFQYCWVLVGVYLLHLSGFSGFHNVAKVGYTASLKFRGSQYLPVQSTLVLVHQKSVVNCFRKSLKVSGVIKKSGNLELKFRFLH